MVSRPRDRPQEDLVVNRLRGRRPEDLEVPGGVQAGLADPGDQEDQEDPVVRAARAECCHHPLQPLHPVGRVQSCMLLTRGPSMDVCTVIHGSVL